MDLPLVAYNAEYSTQTPFALDTICALAEEGTLVGLKDSSDFMAFRRAVVALRDRPVFRFLTGHAFLADAAVMMGAHGCVPTWGNVIPATFAQVYERARAGDWIAASALQSDAVRAADLLDAWGPDSVFGTFLGAAKTALYLLGILGSPTSGAPYSEATPEQTERVRKAMSELAVLASQPTGLRHAG